MNHLISIGPLESFLIAISVLFLGHFVNAKLPVLKKYNIPEPIVGGLIVALAITGLHFNGIDLEFSLPLQNTFMLMFFATVGLAANYTQLMKGGAKVFLFLGRRVGLHHHSKRCGRDLGYGVRVRTADGLDCWLDYSVWWTRHRSRMVSDFC